MSTGYFLEYDDPRSGDFAPLRFVPKGKIVILGLVTTKLRKLESKDELKRRIEEAAKYLPLGSARPEPAMRLLEHRRRQRRHDRGRDGKAPACGGNRERGLGMSPEVGKFSAQKFNETGELTSNWP